jgi:superkiller protein 8
VGGSWKATLLVGMPYVSHSWRNQRSHSVDKAKPGDIWAVALSADGNYLASSSINGKIHVWSLNKAEGMPKIREYETKGSFGLCVDLVCYSPRSCDPSLMLFH